MAWCCCWNLYMWYLQGFPSALMCSITASYLGKFISFSWDLAFFFLKNKQPNKKNLYQTFCSATYIPVLLHPLPAVLLVLAGAFSFARASLARGRLLLCISCLITFSHWPFQALLMPLPAFLPRQHLALMETAASLGWTQARCGQGLRPSWRDAIGRKNSKTHITCELLPCSSDAKQLSTACVVLSSRTGKNSAVV